MGFAKIVANSGKGLYLIEINTGENQRLALLKASDELLAKLGEKITASSEQVSIADALEAQARAGIAALIAQIVVIAEGDLNYAVVAKLISDAQGKYKTLVQTNQPVRRQYQALKIEQASALRKRNEWNALQTKTQRAAWCADYTTEATAGPGAVATIDIPGDVSLVLLAPECRAAQAGDGTVSDVRKQSEIDAVNATLVELQKEERLIRETNIPAAQVQEAALLIARNNAQAALVASFTVANQKALDKATADLASKRLEINNLRARLAVLGKQIASYTESLRYWQNRASSDVPYFGDGAYLSRELCSPANAFFNAAIFPAWQKFKPTYRQGTIDSIDRDAGLATVILPDTRSTASNLPIDQDAQLDKVPFSYMGCGHAAFQDGDSVVISFPDLKWNNPVIVGFVEKPRPCPLQFVGGSAPFNLAPAVQLQVGVPMAFQQMPNLALDDLINAFGDSIENCWSGGLKPYSYEFIDGAAPPGVIIDQNTGKITGTPNAQFDTRTLKIRCFDALYEEGKNERYADSTAIEFSYGQVIAVNGAIRNEAVDFYGYGSVFKNGEIGRWHLAGDSPWATEFLTQADLSIKSPRFNQYCVLLHTDLDGVNDYANFDPSGGSPNVANVWAPIDSGLISLNSEATNLPAFKIATTFGIPDQFGTTTVDFDVGYYTDLTTGVPLVSMQWLATNSV